MDMCQNLWLHVGQLLTGEVVLHRPVDDIMGAGLAELEQRLFLWCASRKESMQKRDKRIGFIAFSSAVCSACR